MIPAIRAEFRKLLTVRTTYFLTAFVLLVVGIVAFYIEGYKLSPADLKDPMQISKEVLGSLNSTLFGAIVAILLVTHEYRYSTILYTLTSTKNRLTILFAKFIVVSTYAICLTTLIAVLSPLISSIGIHVHGATLVPQTIHVGDLMWRALFYGWAYGIAGLVIAIIVRSQVAAIAVLFVIPALAEPLLGQLLKAKSVYLPFAAQGQVIGNSGPSGASLAPGTAAMVFGVYLLLAFVIGAVLFIRRDAN